MSSSGEQRLQSITLLIAPLYFTDDMAEASQAEVTIHCVDPLALTLLVDFSYTGELAVCEENVQVRVCLVALTSGFNKLQQSEYSEVNKTFIAMHGNTLRCIACIVSLFVLQIHLILDCKIV